MKWLRRWFYSCLDWLYIFRQQFFALIARDDPHRYTRNVRAGRVPIVLIPGIYEPWYIMKPIADALVAEGYPVHIIEGLGYNTGKVPAMALLVRHYVDSQGLKDAIIVAHSKGGLIGKYVLANHNSDGVFRHMIAVATPFSGSMYAYFAPIRGIRIFTPKGDLITQLSANAQLNTRVTSIYSAFDPNIPSTSHLEGAANVVVAAIGHFRILEDAEVRAAMLEALAKIRVGRQGV
jgi:triacylglycerol lipase